MANTFLLLSYPTAMDRVDHYLDSCNEHQPLSYAVNDPIVKLLMLFAYIKT